MDDWRSQGKGDHLFFFTLLSLFLREKFEIHNKERKQMEKMAPELQKQKEHEEMMARLAAMPPWKRKLAEKSLGIAE